MENTENKFKHDGLWYIAVELDGCRNCDFMRDDGGCSAEQKRAQRKLAVKEIKNGA